MKRRVVSASCGWEKEDKNSSWHWTIALTVEGLKIEEAGADGRSQLILDTLIEVASEFAPQGKRKKQITHYIAIETVDRKRKELREIEDKTIISEDS